MASITTAPGLVSIDPIQGLVDYVTNIKPYHTKIIEVLFEYVYTDDVDVTIKDTMELDIDMSTGYYANATAPTNVEANVFWYDTTNNTLYIRSYDNTTWIPYLTNYSGSSYAKLSNLDNGSVDTTVTEFIETLVFDWSGNYSYPTVTPVVTTTADQIALAGNITTQLKPADLTELNGTAYSIVSFAYDALNKQTIVTLNAAPTYTVGQNFIVQNVDVTFWYQFTIESVNPVAQAPSQAPNATLQGASNAFIELPHPVLYPQMTGGFTQAPTITVLGNATTAIQVGAEFVIQGSSANNGLYYAVYLQYLPQTNQTLIGVGPTTGVSTPVLTATGGGIVVPYRFKHETQTGSYDNSGYDTTPYDQNAGSIIYQ